MSTIIGRPLDRMELDFIMNSAQAREYGIIDDIIDRPST